MEEELFRAVAYLTFEQRERLRTEAYERRLSQSIIMREALQMLFDRWTKEAGSKVLARG
jgi:hypothetical protein